MNDTDTKHKDEIIERPSRAWVNWWCITLPAVDLEGAEMDPGEIVEEDRRYPSKEVAEQRASDCLLKATIIYGCHPAEYLGAFPEGVRP